MPIDLSSIALSLCEIVFDDLKDLYKEKKKILRLKKDITAAFKGAFAEIADTFPFFIHKIAEDDTFFERYRVKQELGKLVTPTEKPNINVLDEEWERHFGKPEQGSPQIFIDVFLKKAENELVDCQT